MAKFAEVIECLNQGGYASRNTWLGNKKIVKQIPQCIDKVIVPKMTSLPMVAKQVIGSVGSGEISYHDQVIIISLPEDKNTPASATYYIPTWEDIFADDWCCATPV